MEQKDYRLAAIMYTDIAGFSRMMEKDEAGTLELLRYHNDLIKGIVASHHGTVIKTIGDAFLVDFKNTVEALQSALEIQDKLYAHNKENQGLPLLVRIGVHLGDIYFFESDALGEGINIAARLQSLARPGCVCFSQDVYNLVLNKIEFRAEKLGKVSLKNITKEIHAYEITTPNVEFDANRDKPRPGYKPGSYLGEEEDGVLPVGGIASSTDPHAEVFIFHQRSRKHFLFVFPLQDGEFYYYQNGRLIANERYWRDQEHFSYEPEVGLYRRFHPDTHPNMVSVFLYCGHEIPELSGVGYDASYPDRSFTIHDLVGALPGLMSDSTRFDLMVLSTCFGGTPYTIGALAPFARYIVASPDNLHLSYFDLRSLERLDLGLRDGDMPAFAKRFAQQAFDRLAKEIQTAVSVAVYDVDSVQEYLQSVHTMYGQTLTALNAEARASGVRRGRCDCADRSVYALPGIGKGVDVFYRPARFGRLRQKQSHSGWECWKD